MLCAVGKFARPLTLQASQTFATRTMATAAVTTAPSSGSVTVLGMMQSLRGVLQSKVSAAIFKLPVLNSVTRSPSREALLWSNLTSTSNSNSLLESNLILSSTMKKRKMAMNKHKLKKRRKALRMNTKRSRA